MKSFTSLLLTAVLLGPLTTERIVNAAEPYTEHTFRLADGEARPAATLDHADWMVGSWTGTAFGKKFEEVWNAPSAGSMVGLFKLFDDDEVSFYELLLMTIDDGSLSLKVKHFNPDFSAWEDKEEHVNFRLVKMSDDELHFSGISFYRRNEDLIEAYIVLRDGDETAEHKLVYTRQN